MRDSTNAGVFSANQLGASKKCWEKSRNIFFYLFIRNKNIHYNGVNLIIVLLLIMGLNMFLILINISTFHFSSSKIFLQLLVPIKFSIITSGPSIKVNS